MSADLAKVRIMLETVRKLATHLTEDEISDLGLVLQKAIDRMIKEQEG